MPPSPIQEFRDLLKKTPEELEAALSKRGAASRQMLERKIQEYNALPADERNRRLYATEVRWYLQTLLPMAKPERDQAVKSAPILWQPHVMERLAAWDKLGPALQKEALEHQKVVEYLSAPAGKQEAVYRSLPPVEQAALASRIESLQRLSQTQRAELDDRLAEFFSMGVEKQRRALNDFSAAELAGMKITLDKFRSLSPGQRDVCIKSFAKLASMAPEEQIAFLKNADRWNAMSAKEREMWRQVVAIVPPMPELPRAMPPMPRP